MAPSKSEATFDQFQGELARLVDRFDRQFPEFTSPDYNEATLRADLLDPFFRALGWDVGNTKGLIHTEREVDIEVRTAVSGRQTRADYVFRAARVERFTCEAKKPAEVLSDPHIFQAKRDAYARGVPLALLSDFQELKIFVVGARPHRDEPHVGEWKVLNFRQYPAAAREIWDLLAYENVTSGSIDRLIDSLPKRPLRLKGKQGYLIRPDRNRSLDADFLNFLDDVRQQLGSDLLKHNDRTDLLVSHRLNEAAQHIIDRLVFLRICEDRGIDTGQQLQSLFDGWYRQQQHPPRLHRPGRQTHLRFGTEIEEDPAPYDAGGRTEGSLYLEIVEHIRSLDQRPPSYKPFFNGQLFKAHFSEDLTVGDEWLANFILDLTDDDTGYNFATIKVEILGDVYERFLGKVLRPQGRGATIEEKPEVRKAGGVYYTPRYITDYIVEQTVGRLVDGKTPKEVQKLRILDPACGSGSFLLRAYERVMEHYLRWFTADPKRRREEDCYVDAAGNVRLTSRLKRRILKENIYGVDIDAQAVEVTQLSLYLKMLEGENRETLRAQTELFRGEALLPPLDQNVRCFNSLIASDFSLDPDELVRVNAGDWEVQFPAIMKAGGFDAVIGNPPWGYEFHEQELEYLREHHREIIVRMVDSFMYFTQLGLSRLTSSGRFGMILPDVMLYQGDAEKLRRILLARTTLTSVCNMGDVFEKVTRPACIVTCRNGYSENAEFPITDLTATTKPEKAAKLRQPSSFKTITLRRIRSLPGSMFPSGQLPQLELWHRIQKVPNRALLDFVDNDGIQRGVSPDLKDAFLVDSATAAKWRLEKSHLRPSLTGGIHVRRYAIEQPDLFIIYTTRDDDFSKLPHIRTFIDQFRKEITCKEVQQKKHSLYALHRARDRKIFEKAEKLVGVITEDEIVLALDDRQTFPTDGLYVFAPKGGVSAKYLMGILNSGLFVTLYRLISSEEGRVLAQVKPTMLAKLPIRVLNQKMKEEKLQYDRLVALVDRILTLTPALRGAKTDVERTALQNAVTKADRDIDQLVYQLYGLTPQEIALVEGGAAAPAREAD